jgi:hypothetical protein
MKKLLLAIGLSALPVLAQSSFKLVPDCLATFSFNATGPYTTFVNSQGCVSWTLVYSSTGFSALSLVFQSAPGTSSPGTWVTYAGTLATGANPNTNTVGAVSTFTNGTVATPFLRVDLTSVSGSGVIQGMFYGWRSGSGGGGGGGGSGCAGTVATPCVTGAENSSGAAVTDFTCDLTAPFNVSSSSGDFQIVAGSSGKQVRICHVSFSSTVISNFKLDYGTGTNCGTGTTAVTGNYQNTLTFALDFDPRAAPLIPAGNAVCGNFGSTVTSGGTLQYALF